MSELLWRPSAQRIAAANFTAFAEFVRKSHGRDVSDFQTAYDWSIRHPALFWQAVWQFCDLQSSRGSDEVVSGFTKMPGAEWFPAARLNFAENLLRYRDDRDALIFWNEQGPQRRVSYRQLYQHVANLSESFQRLGVEAGDRVAGYMPNMPETVIAMLATTSLGAIWSSCSPDFGSRGLVDRFGQIEPKVLVTADGYFYNGKVHRCLARVREVRREMPSLQQVVVVPYLNEQPELSGGWLHWPELINGASLPEIAFAQLPFDHPLYIMYSSGTTGPPKCIVHGAGGTLLQHLKELVLHTDLRREDRIIYYTTCGWMMWNWLISSLAVGATVLLYDGAPFHPHASQMFDIIDSERVTVFGTSAKFLSAAEKERLHPKATHDLSSLRTILSTGSPLVPESYDYVYDRIKSDVCLCSISGGTDIISCFGLGDPVGAVYRGELQTRGLGMKVEIFDDHGAAVDGEKGELVCTAPFPSMPLGFWNDPDGRHFHDAYFARYLNVWRHGDYAKLTETGGLVIYGRSDTVLNPGGVRIGTAEIYRLVEQFPEVLESIVVGQIFEGDLRIVLFVRLRPDVELDQQLTQRIKDHIRCSATPRHVPAKVIAVADIPRTRSGKIVELAVREIIHNRPVKNELALANPEALELFKDLPELR
jgi:acetoacetyl-CoA synthetase